MRWAAKSDQRKPWSDLFFLEDFKHPLRAEAAGSYFDVLEMVRWAPSATNKQPWRIVQSNDGKTYHFFLERDPRYLKTMNTTNLADLQMVDIGIGLCHFLASTEALGFKGRCIDDSTVKIECPENTEYVLSWKENS